MKTSKDILKFQQNCFKNYLNDIREAIPDFPEKYLFPDENPILPVLPVKTAKEKIMFVGAFPSARFENRNGLLIPVANNLSPFGKEEYFDGQQTREQASREVLDRLYFTQLDIYPNKHWVTDLVKVYLMPPKHIENCIQINSTIKYTDTYKLFKKIAKASLNWFHKEVEICNPKLIITFGEVVARTVLNDNKSTNAELLNGEIRVVRILGKNYDICPLPHPEIVRRNIDWRINNDEILYSLTTRILELENSMKLEEIFERRIEKIAEVISEDCYIMLIHFYHNYRKSYFLELIEDDNGEEWDSYFKENHIKNGIEVWDDVYGHWFYVKASDKCREIANKRGLTPKSLND